MNIKLQLHQALWIFLMPALLLVLVACASAAGESSITEAAPESTAELANPASENCVEQGGNLIIEERGDGGQFGVCYFEDNRQCEEWALLRGDCPVGGLKVTGYITDAARYCAIIGGEYTITSGGAEDEQGTCTLPDGSQCNAEDFYNGQCVPGTASLAAETQTSANAGATIQPLVEEVCNGQAQAMAHFLDVLEVTQSEAPLTDPAPAQAAPAAWPRSLAPASNSRAHKPWLESLGDMLEEQGWSRRSDARCRRADGCRRRVIARTIKFASPAPCGCRMSRPIARMTNPSRPVNWRRSSNFTRLRSTAA